MEEDRLTWNEIQKKYPDQHVGLVDVEWGINSATVKSAIVKYNKDNISDEELLLMAYRGDIVREYTTPDSTLHVGALTI